MLILCTVRLQADDDRPAFMSTLCPMSSVNLTNFSKSYVPCSVAATSFPFALQPSEKPYFQAGSPFLPKTFAVSLAVARQCRDNLPSSLTKTALQPGNAFLPPRHFPSSHLPWRPSCLWDKNWLWSSFSFSFPLLIHHFYLSWDSSATQILGKFQVQFLLLTPSLYLILLFLCARQSL